MHVHSEDKNNLRYALSFQFEILRLKLNFTNIDTKGRLYLASVIEFRMISRTPQGGMRGYDRCLMLVIILSDMASHADTPSWSQR
jgi:hypothetical protein